jgi:hypothetical protein
VESQYRQVASRDDGAAVLLVLIVVSVLAGLAFAALSLADLEGAASANDAQAASVSYAADAAMDRVVRDLGAIADWTSALAGTSSSSLREVVAGPRAPWAEVLDLPAMTAELQGEADRVPSADRTRWTIFLAGPLTRMLPDSPPDVLPYVVAWVGDDPMDGDGNPWLDANQVVRIRVSALGPRGVRADREAVIERVRSSAVARVRARWVPG